MLEKLVPGRYLRFPSIHQAARAHNAVFPSHFVEGAGAVLNIGESESEGPLATGRQISAIGTGAHGSRSHRTFRWLPYVPGKVTYLPLAGPDMLTGKMTGCWITIFEHRGCRYAAHIGTEENAGTPNSKQARKAWRDAEQSGVIRLVAGFNPVSLDMPKAVAEQGSKAKEFFAALDPGGNFFTVVFGTTTDATLRKIYAVHRMPPKNAVRFLGE